MSVEAYRLQYCSAKKKNRGLRALAHRNQTLTGLQRARCWNASADGMVIYFSSCTKLTGGSNGSLRRRL